MNSWKYYNHALIPTTPPHEKANVEELDNPAVWSSQNGAPLFARWTSRFDCGFDTGWYWCILDRPVDIHACHRNIRYEINRAVRDVDVRIINVDNYVEDMYEIDVAARQTYKGTSTSTSFKEIFRNSLKMSYIDGGGYIFGAFLKGDKKLIGWVRIQEFDTHINLVSQKAIPEYEKYRVNIALVYAVCVYYKDKLAEGKYISDGQRNMYHQTNFMTFLEKYFGFRKVYCCLHLRYRHPCLWRLLYPFRKIIKLIPLTLANQLSAVLSMEEIVRNQKKF